jgi:hypothetical protein
VRARNLSHDQANLNLQCVPKLPSLRGAPATKQSPGLESVTRRLLRCAFEELKSGLGQKFSGVVL